MTQKRNPEELKTLLTFLRIEFEEASSGGELVTACPYCGKERGHHYVNLTSDANFCHHCGKGGGDFSRKVLSLVAATSAHTYFQEGMQYFQNRGIREPGKWLLGYYPRLQRYTIPYVEDGEVIDISFRALADEEPKYLRLPGTTARPYVAVQSEDPQVVVFTEGELDAILLAQDIQGKVLGIPGALTFPRGLKDHLLQGIPTVIVFDNDDVGIAGAKKLKKKLSALSDTVIALVPPDHKDISEFAQRDHDTYLKWVADIAHGAELARYGPPGDAPEAPDPENLGEVVQVPSRQVLPFRGVNSREYLGMVEERTPWLIDEIWNDRAIGFVAGFPKAMKSMLVIDMAAAVALGRPFLGHQTGDPRGVLLFQEEDADYVIRQRILKAVTHGVGPGASTNLWVFTPRVMGESLNLSNPVSMQRLRATIDFYKPGLVVLDPFANISGLDDENSATAVNRVLEAIRSIRDENEVGFAIVHHLRKSAESKMGQRMRGSSVLHAKSECAIYVTRNGRILTLNLESKVRPDVTMVAKYTDAGTFEQVMEEKTADAEEAVLSNLTGWLSAARLSERTGLPLSVVVDSLESLAESGRVIKRSEGDEDAAVVFFSKA